MFTGFALTRFLTCEDALRCIWMESGMAELPIVFTVSEFCAIFKIAKSTFWLWAKNQNFRLIRIGNRTYIPAQEVNRLLNGDAS